MQSGNPTAIKKCAKHL